MTAFDDHPERIEPPPIQTPPPPPPRGSDLEPFETPPYTLDEGGSAWLFPVYLLFRPGFFFRRFGVRCPMALVFGALWLVGVAGVVDRLEMNTAIGRSFPIDGWQDDWLVYWGIVGMGSLLAGLGAVLIQGGWYWARMFFCGLRGHAFDDALRLMSLSSLVTVVPAIGLAIASTLMYATPAAASLDDSWTPTVLAAIVLPFIFWTSWTSYRGVSAAFRPQRVPAVIWFLVLPWVVKALGLAALVVAAVLLGMSRGADLDNTHRHNGRLYRLEFPGNWQLDPEMAEFEDGGVVSVKPLFQDALLEVSIYEPSGSPAEELEASKGFYVERGFELTEREAIDTLGPWSGSGARYDAVYDGSTYTLRLLVVELTEWYNADITLLSLPADASKVEPGFDLVLGTLKIRTPDRAPASLDDAYEVRSGSVTARVPGNWTWNDETSGGSRPEEVSRALEIYPHASGIVRVLQYPSDLAPEEEAERTVESFVGEGTETGRAAIERWGALEGTGFEVAYESPEGEPRVMRVLVAPADGDRLLELHAMWTGQTADVLAPGLDLVAGSIESE